MIAFLRLVPSEHSSDATTRRGGITNAGNALARRAVIEGALTYSVQARVGRKLRERNERLLQAIRDIAWKAQVRLCARYHCLSGLQSQRDRHRCYCTRDGRLPVGDHTSSTTPAGLLKSAAPPYRRPGQEAGSGADPRVLFEPALPTLAP